MLSLRRSFTASAVAMFIGLAGALVPTSMQGVWSAEVVTSIQGPGIFVGNVTISAPDSAGNVFIRQFQGAQLFRLGGGLMQYCFEYNLPSQYADEAPFVVSEVRGDELTICWRGPRLPTHKENCSGCSCASWTLRVSGDEMTSVFQMSPPAVHMQMNLKRIGQALDAESVRDGWDCQFDNHTGHPNRTLIADAGTVGSKRAHGTFSPAKVGSLPLATKQCIKLNEAHDVELRYEASATPCWPCDVKFELTTPAASMTGRYLAIGFKGMNAAYTEKDDYKVMSGGLGEKPDYWGMSSDAVSRNQTDLAGRILLGYVSEEGRACVRHMEARAFVGAPTDVPNDGFVRNLAMEHIRGRMTISFTASIHAGNTTSDLDWQRGAFGRWRVMWATGEMGSGNACHASPQFHGPTRALANLGFPGWGQQCDSTTQEDQMLDSDAFALGVSLIV